MTGPRVAFLGVDLAWSPRNASGVAALRREGALLTVEECGLRASDDEIVEFVRAHATPSTILMVDAPLVLTNRTGMRRCDRLTHERFGRQEAGAYPANRGNMGRYNGGAPRGEALGIRLRDRLGFAWPPPGVREAAAQAGRFVFECYPHPAQVVLFGLDRTLKYKRKSQGIATARAEFARYLRHVLALRSPRLALGARLARDLEVTRASGRAYKEREDRLDALFCAYLAALVPEGRMEDLGDPREGSIVVPTADRRLLPRSSRGLVRGG